MVLLVMCVGYFLVLLDVTIVNVALPHIGAGLDAGVSGLQWVVDGYAIALAALMLAGGTIGDRRGHKRVVLAGLAVFGAGSAGCGLAPDVGVLIAARVVQGIGAALLLPGTLAIVTHAYPEPSARARAIGVWAGVGSAALPAGPVLGGALVAGLGWRSVFFLNLPIVVLALPVAAAVVRESSEATGRRLDAAGSALAAALLAALTYALIERSIAAGTAAAVLLAAFVAVERRRPDPMLPLGLLRRRAFTVANGAAGTMNLCTLGMLFVVTLFLQDVQGRAPLAAGLVLLPLFAPLAVVAPLTGRAIARVGPRVPMAAGLVLAAAGLALLAGVTADTPAAELVPALLLWGGGLGVLTPAVVAAAMGAVARERAGLAAAVNNTARQAGGAIGIAAFGALAGAPAARERFLSGLHAGALFAAGLYLVVAVLAARLIPRAA